MHGPSELARHDPPLAQAKIVKVTHQRRPAPGMDERVPFADGEIRIQGPYYLTPLDQSVLLAVLAQAHRMGEATAEAGAVGFAGSGEIPGHWSVHTTLYALGQDVYGHPPQGRSYANLRESLDRLASVTVGARDGRHWARSWLLAVRGNDETGEVRITLSWRLARALAGEQWVSINLAERRALRSSIAEVLHQFFAASIRPRSSWPYHYRTLEPRVWIEEAGSESAARKRRQRLREALREIGDLPGWTVEGLEGPGPVRVWRRAKGHAGTG